jgi:hypothetical protein
MMPLKSVHTLVFLGTAFVSLDIKLTLVPSLMLFLFLQNGSVPQAKAK